jgi:hypothetical protein
MEILVQHIYHSPIGKIKITADEHCVTELVFVEASDLSDVDEPAEALPEIINRGTLSAKADATAVMALVPPGPEVTKATPTELMALP